MARKLRVGYPATGAGESSPAVLYAWTLSNIPDDDQRPMCATRLPGRFAMGVPPGRGVGRADLAGISPANGGGCGAEGARIDRLRRRSPS
jgi:hypothetical protein